MTTDTIAVRYLSPKGVDDIRILTTNAMRSAGVEEQASREMSDVVEKILLRWTAVFGEETGVSFLSGSRFGKRFITLKVAGKPANPLDIFSGESEEDGRQSILTDNGLAPEYTYEDDTNIITIYPRTLKNRQAQWVMAAIILGAVAGFLLRSLPEETCTVLSRTVFYPFFGMILDLIVSVSIPLMFFSMICVVVSVGDPVILGTSAGKAIRRYLGRVTLVVLAGILMAAPFLDFNIVTALSDIDDMYSLYTILLGTVPVNIFSPFIERNVVQIIFLALLIGVAMLTLLPKISYGSRVVHQMNDIVTLISRWIGYVMPVFVFFCVVLMILSDFSRIGMQVVLVVWLITAGFGLNLGISVAEVSLSKKISPRHLLKKIKVPVLTAFTTASVSAAYQANIVCCRNLGVAEKLTSAALPFGSMILRSGQALLYCGITLSMAVVFDIPVTFSWIVILIGISVLVTISSHQMHTSGAGAYALLFIQLGIPAGALAVAIGLHSLCAYVGAALTTATADLDLLQVAGDLELLDEELLRSDL